ncbi:MAG: pilus assembly protein TadG-related protein, partial [Terriglobales bacterium]
MNGLSRTKPDLQRRSGERGQTIILVAVSLVSLLAMAALAIDVVTLYVARGEMQRAADAAALAGAKAFVDSGVTTDPTNVSRQALAQTLATTVINSIRLQNKIQGVAPVLVAATPDLTRQGNPQITVTLQRTDLPTFFSRIWGTRLSTVSATAVAEAYNAASSQTNIGTYIPITPKCVKPLLVVNKDPVTATPLVDPLTGAATATEIGRSLTLTQACTTAGPATCASSLPALAGTYYPAKIVAPNPGNLCPSCIGAADYEQSIECCDFNPYSCSTALAASQVQVDMTISHGQLRNQTDNGVQC